MQNIKNKQATSTSISPHFQSPTQLIIPSPNSTFINAPRQQLIPNSVQSPSNQEHSCLSYTKYDQKLKIKADKQKSQENNEQYYKIMCMMRQQIQIAANFYTGKMKQLVNEQAKEICKLRTMLQQNQKQLAKKNSTILQMRETPKKKISIVSNQQQDANYENNLQINEKIGQLKTRLDNLEGHIAEKHEAQIQLNRKIEQFEKGTVKYLSSKLSRCNKRLDDYIQNADRQVQKIVLQVKKMKQINTSKGQESQLHQKQDNNQQKHSQSHHLNVKMSRLHKQLGEVRRQMENLKMKQYKHDNYEVQKLRIELVRINKVVCTIQKKESMRTNTSIRQKSQQYQSQRFIENKQTQIKQIRSQKIIQQPPLPHTSIGFNQRPIGNARNNHHNDDQHFGNNSNVVLGYSTPLLMRNLSDGHFGERGVNLDKSNKNNMMMQAQVRDNSPGIAKASKLSTQASRAITKPPNTLYHEFYEQNEHQHQSECESYEQSFHSDEDFTQQQQQEQQHEQSLQQRLINTIQNLKMKMPVLAEIDQTGCLKCVQTGMYLVDSNSDVFYLDEQQLWNLEKKGIIKICH